MHKDKKETKLESRQPLLTNQFDQENDFTGQSNSIGEIMKNL
jgi:hypothetical protein